VLFSLHTRWTLPVRSYGVALFMLLAGCASGPAPIPIYQDQRSVVELRFDPKAGTGHSHPATLTAEQVGSLLRSVWIKRRDVATGAGPPAVKEETPAFSPADIVVLAPHLSKALSKASRKDLVTFYLAIPDATHGTVVTSGAVVVRSGLAFLTLVNCRSYLAGGREMTASAERQIREKPLVSIASDSFLVGFSPGEARVSWAQLDQRREGYRGGPDEGKVVVIDLARLPVEPPKASAPPGPEPAAPRR